MKVCVFGAGAVGGHVAARLAASAVAQVSVVARGANLAAIRAQGLSLRRGGERIDARLHAATDDSAGLPPQDLVVVTMKAPALPRAATAIARLLAPHGSALFVTNGIPWWWNHGQPGDQAALPLLDPAGELWTLLRARTLGCVCYASSEMSAPGMIDASATDRWIVGDPEAGSSARLDNVRALFQRAGFAVTASANLRRDVLHKLLVNVSLNPISALTRLGTRELCSDPALRGLMVAVMREALALARALGHDLDAEIDLEALTSPAARAPTHRASMLQDALQGRPLETEAILGQVASFARERAVETPSIALLLTLVRGLDRSFRA